MIIYCLNSPDDNVILLTGSLAAVVAAQKGAQRDGVELEIGTWDTDKSAICTLTIKETPECSPSTSLG